MFHQILKNHEPIQSSQAISNHQQLKYKILHEVSPKNELRFHNNTG
jgi:hypothetical protein